MRSLDRIVAHMVRCLLLQEERRLAVLRVILSKFEATGGKKDIVRRTEVYDVVADYLGTVTNNDIGEEVRAALRGVPGVYAIKSSNVRYFRGLRKRVPGRPG